MSSEMVLRIAQEAVYTILIVISPVVGSPWWLVCWLVFFRPPPRYKSKPFRLCQKL